MYSQGLGGGGGGGGWGKRSCCYFTIGLIFGDFPRRCHILSIDCHDSKPKLIFRAFRLRSVSGVNLPMTLKGFAIIDTNSSQLL